MVTIFSFDHMTDENREYFPRGVDLAILVMDFGRYFSSLVLDKDEQRSLTYSTSIAYLPLLLTNF